MRRAQSCLRTWVDEFRPSRLHDMLMKATHFEDLITYEEEGQGPQLTPLITPGGH